MTDFKAKIRKASDPINVENIIVTIFGDPGMGKTSLSMTAENPIHLDYDEGVERAVGRKDSMQIDSWQDGIDLLQSNYIEENGVKTIIVDTVGTALDNFCARFVIEENPKNGKAGGGLAIGGYGAMKDKFAFFKMLACAKKVDIVLLCHSGDEKDDEKNKKIPKITGGSYDIVKQASDLIGFMESRGNKRTLDFNSTDRHDGKNCPNFPLLTLPNYTEPAWGTYLADLIKKTKEHMNRMSEEQTNALKDLTEIRNLISGAEVIPDLEPVKLKIATLSKPLQIQLQKAFESRFVQLWTKEFIAPLSGIPEFDAMIKTIEGVEKVYVIPLKLALMEHAKTKGFTFEKGDAGFKKKVEEKGEFPDKETKITPVEEKDSKKTETV
jgi:hypothetical protein